MSGDTDGVCSTHSTQEWVFNIPNSSYKPHTHWKEWSILEGDHNWQTAGFLTKFTGGLSFSTVRNAGHEVPWYRPAEAFHLFKQFINGSQLFIPGYDEYDSPEYYYGIASLECAVKMLLHSSTVPVSEFLDPEKKDLLSFVARSIRHVIERSGIVVHMVTVEGVKEASNSKDTSNEGRRLSKSTTKTIDVSVRIDAVISFDMNDVTKRRTSQVLVEPFDTDIVTRSTVSALGFDISEGSNQIDSGKALSSDERKLTSALERKHQKLVDSNLNLAALQIKEKATTEMTRSFFDGMFEEYLNSALFAATTAPSPELDPDVKVADVEINVASGYTYKSTPSETLFSEWDPDYENVQFSDLTLSPTKAPVFLGTDSSTPIYIFTQSSWVVLTVSAIVTGSISSLVGYLMYKRSMRSANYYPVSDDTGDVELTVAEESY